MEFEQEKCMECCAYGDDYSIDDNGEIVKNCDDCIYNPYREENGKCSFAGFWEVKDNEE